jgi:hypothetical protein
MIVLVDKRRTTGIGESLSGDKAFYINANLIDNWYGVEMHPDFQRLSPQEQNEVRTKYSRSVLIHLNIEAIHFN